MYFDLELKKMEMTTEDNMNESSDSKTESGPDPLFTSWKEKVKSLHVPREDINKLVMEYLVKEGYKDAVVSFRQETGIDPQVNVNSMEDQTNIRQAVEAGRIQDAVEMVNNVDPEILDTNQALYFHLQQQQLLELIKTGDMSRTLDYACSELSARGEENPGFLEELEQCLSLLAFEDPKSSPYSHLLENSQKLKLISELNSALLASQDQEPSSRLVTLMKLVLWSQHHLEKKGVPFPKLADIADGKLQPVPPKQPTATTTSQT